MESKDDARDRGGDLPLMAEVARYFKDQAFMCAKDEGLEVPPLEGDLHYGDASRTVDIQWRAV